MAFSYDSQRRLKQTDTHMYTQHVDIFFKIKVRKKLKFFLTVDNLIFSQTLGLLHNIGY